MDTGKKSINSPTPTTTVSSTPTATSTPPGEPTESAEPTEPTESIEPTEPSQAPSEPVAAIKEHIVVAGENINAITKKYYGDALLVSKLCTYNNISDPNKIKVGQVIKIPPKETLK